MEFLQTNGKHEALANLAQCIEHHKDVDHVTLLTRRLDSPERTLLSVRIDDLVVVTEGGQIVERPSSVELGQEVCRRIDQAAQEHVRRDPPDRPPYWAAFRWRAWTPNGGEAVAYDGSKSWTIQMPGRDALTSPRSGPVMTPSGPAPHEQAAQVVVAMLGRLESTYSGAMNVISEQFRRLIESQAAALEREREDVRWHRGQHDELLRDLLQMRYDHLDSAERSAAEVGRSQIVDGTFGLLGQALQAIMGGDAALLERLGPLAPALQHPRILAALQQPHVQRMLSDPAALDGVAELLELAAAQGQGQGGGSGGQAPGVAPPVAAGEPTPGSG